jgi:DNA-binding response OmpR family regulator
MYEKILIIDDDKKLNSLLVNYLKKFNFAVSTETNPRTAIIKLKNELPDLIILDIMLPEIDGFELCKQIRMEYTVPIIMLTARGEVSDRILGLELGADDYLPKPFEPRELVARIQSILRRNNPSFKKENLKSGNLSLDYNTRTAYKNKNMLKLTTAEFNLLEIFLKNPGRIFSRDLIMEKLRGIETLPFSRSIDVLISRLRQKIEDNPKKPVYIKTVWGSGYIYTEQDK